MNQQVHVAEAVSAAGLEPGAVCLAPSPAEGTPQPPAGPWLVVPYGAQFVVGGLARATFAPYESLWSFEDAVRLAVGLASTPATWRQASPRDSLLALGVETARAIGRRVEARGGEPGPTRVSAGDVLDCVEPETAHHLYALGTGFRQRSQPPDAIGGPYHQYEVLAPLPETVSEGVATPWFGQPGGGSMLVLDRPIRWFVDRDMLVELIYPQTSEGGRGMATEPHS